MGQNKQDTTVVAGRGFIWITLAKLYFMVTGAVLMLGLPRLLGSTELFGDFATVNSLIRIINMVMITATLQAVAKLTSEREETAGAVRWAAFRIQLFIGGTIFLSLFFGAELISVSLLKDPNLTGYLKIAAFIPLFYSFYAVMVGLLNGLKRFLPQAGLDVTFSTLKTGLIIGLVLFGYAVEGAFFGFSLAAFVILLVAAGATSSIRRTEGQTITHKKLLQFMIPIMAYTLFYNLLLNQDLLLIKALKYQPLLEHFQSGVGKAMLEFQYGMLGIDVGSYPELANAAATSGTSTLSGLFGAMKTISTLPYQAVISVTFVVFPLISQSSFQKESEQTRVYIKNTFRFSFLVIMFMLAVLLPTCDQLIVILYGEAYRVGSTALQILLLATVLFSLFVICTTIITSAGYPNTTLILGVVTAGINGVLCYAMIQYSGLWKGALWNTAWADLLSMAVGTLLGFAVIARTLSTFPPMLSILRITAATVGTFFLGYLFHTPSKVMVLVKCGAMATAYLVLLALLREITGEDLKIVKRILTGRRQRQTDSPAD